MNLRRIIYVYQLEGHKSRLERDCLYLPIRKTLGGIAYVRQLERREL